MFIDNHHEYDLKYYKVNKKTFKNTFDLKKSNSTEIVEITGDIAGQVRYAEKGNDIVLTAYDTQEVTYQKVEVTTSSEKVNGKYKCVTTIYKATYDDSGSVNGYKTEGTIKTTYVNKKGDDITRTTYQTLNSKNKVIDTTSYDITGENKTIVNKSKIIGTVTYKNGNSFMHGVVLISDEIGSINLFDQIYAPVKKGNKYTGSWLEEKVLSTSANETFALGANRNDFEADEIGYDLSQKHGKDTVKLVKGNRLALTYTNDELLKEDFSKKGNNINMSLSKKSIYEGDADYTQRIVEVKKSGSYYNIVTSDYEWNGDEKNTI